MLTRPTTDLTRRLRATGWSRYFDTAFLGLWLTMWTIGEVVALGLIGLMLASAVSAALGRPLALPSRIAPTDGTVSVFLLFLLLWTALWTVGGIAAMWHVLRQLGGEDAVDIAGGTLHLTRRAGPFRRRREIPVTSIRRVRIRSDRAAGVVIDTHDGTRDISDLGTTAERVALRDWLATGLPLPNADAARLIERETPPHDRDVEVRGHETIVTQPTRRGRTMGARVAWGLAAILSLGWVNMYRRGIASGGDLAALAATALVVALALWIAMGRREWIAAPGRLEVHLRFARWTLRRQTFEGGTLQVDHYRDSDGDDRYTLVVRAGDRRRVLASALHDQFELLALGEWLAARTAFAFDRGTLGQASGSGIFASR
jgi:hypothetical protein